MFKLNDTNKVLIEGEVVSKFTLSHEVFGEKFYTVELETARLSGAKDVIPVMISDRLINISENYMGMVFKVSGQFRSYNKHEGDKNRLALSVFAKEVTVIPNNDEEDLSTNEICMDGYICKKPIYRETPLGRKISDLLIAVNRPYGKSDYIPCICWGRNAIFAEGLEVGTRVRIVGRIQSREYLKKLSEVESEKRTAYEVSIGKVEVVDENSNA